MIQETKLRNIQRGKILNKGKKKDVFPTKKEKDITLAYICGGLGIQHLG